MSQAIPTREVLRKRLTDLLTGRLTREEVANWAGEWVRQQAPAVEDFVAWEALRELAGADLRSSPMDYLHDESDFHAWLDRLEGAGDEPIDQ